MALEADFRVQHEAGRHRRQIVQEIGDQRLYPGISRDQIDRRAQRRHKSADQSEADDLPEHFRPPRAIDQPADQSLPLAVCSRSLRTLCGKCQ